MPAFERLSQKKKRVGIGAASWRISGPLGAVDVRHFTPEETHADRTAGPAWTACGLPPVENLPPCELVHTRASPGHLKPG